MKYLRLFEQFEIEKGDILNHPYRTLNDVTEDIKYLAQIFRNHYIGSSFRDKEEIELRLIQNLEKRNFSPSIANAYPSFIKIEEILNKEIESIRKKGGSSESETNEYLKFYNDFAELVHMALTKNINENYSIKNYTYNDYKYIVKYNGDHLYIELPNIGFVEGYKMPIELDIAEDLSSDEIEELGIIDPYFTIKHIEVYDKRKGYGNELMSVFLDITNKLGLNQIILNASPLDRNIDLEGLVAFYEDWGFEVIKKYKDHSIMMLNRL